MNGRALRIIALIALEASLGTCAYDHLALTPEVQPLGLGCVLAVNWFQLTHRVIGLAALGAAFGVLMPRTRAGACLFGLVALAFDAALAVACSGDVQVFAHGSTAASPWSWPFHPGAVATLIRGGLAALLVVANLRPRRPGIWILNCAAIAALALVVVGKAENNLLQSSAIRLLTQGCAQLAGWEFPNLPVRTEDGALTSTKEVLRPGDGVLVVTRTCPACVNGGEQWSVLGGQLSDAGGRLVFLELPTPGVGRGRPDYLQTNGLQEVPYYSLVRIADSWSIGVHSAPHYFQLGAKLRVTRHSNAVIHIPSFLVMHSMFGTECLFEKLVPKMIEAGWTVQGESREYMGVLAGWLVRGSQKMQVLVAGSHPAMERRVECCVAVDADGLIQEFHEIYRSSGLTGRFETSAWQGALPGLSLDEAIHWCQSPNANLSCGFVPRDFAGALQQMANMVRGRQKEVK